MPPSRRHPHPPRVNRISLSHILASTLRRAGLIRADGTPTEDGRAQAAKATRDEHRWAIARQIHQDTALTGRYDGLTPIETVFTPDEIIEFDRKIGGPRIASAT